MRTYFNYLPIVLCQVPILGGGDFYPDYFGPENNENKTERKSEQETSKARTRQTVKKHITINVPMYKWLSEILTA